MTRANTHPLFDTIPANYHRSLIIRHDDIEAKILRGARLEIRAKIRQAFSQNNFEKLKRTYTNELSYKVTDIIGITNEENFSVSSSFVDSISNELKDLKKIPVRFLTQGSYVYGLLVRPSQPKKQEIDLDDGVYFPMPFMDGKPLISSKGIFSILEEILEPLVKKNNWQFEKKNTCIRISISKHNMHIDIPLFAVDIQKFDRIEEKYQHKTGTTFSDSKSLADHLVRDRDIRLGEEDIFLAHRQRNWFPSDPSIVQDWFFHQLEENGEIYKKVICDLKGWRDHRLSDSNLSSLSLMILVADAFIDMEHKQSNDRTDLTILKVLEHLSGRIRQGNITLEGLKEAVDAEWDDAEREKYARAIENLKDELNKLLFNSTHPDLINKSLKSEFGYFFPNAPEKIEFSSDNQIVSDLQMEAVSTPLISVKKSTSA